MRGNPESVTDFVPQARNGGSAPQCAGITGMGYYVPTRVLTNGELERMVDTNDEWIVSRTGISERRLAAADESTADLAEQAARRALHDAAAQPEDVDLIIVATSSPDYQFPSTAALLQHQLGCPCAAFDVVAGCSGFVYALIVAQQFVGTGAARTVLVVGAEVLSRIVDWTDRNTCVLFGDGAGAAVVQAAPSGCGILGFDWGADGSGGHLLKLALRDEDTSSSSADSTGAALSGAVATSEPGRIYQNGREVYRFALKVMGESALRTLERSGLQSDDIDLLVPHQANRRIIEEAAKRLDVPAEKVFINIEKYGNTSAASIPIALCEAREAGRIKPGDIILAVGFGAGLAWASCVMRWTTGCETNVTRLEA